MVQLLLNRFHCLRQRSCNSLSLVGSGFIIKFNSILFLLKPPGFLSNTVEIFSCFHFRFFPFFKNPRKMLVSMLFDTRLPKSAISHLKCNGVVKSCLQREKSAETTFYNLQTKRVRFAALNSLRLFLNLNILDSAMRKITFKNLL